MPVLARRADTAASGRATVVIAEPNPLVDSPTQNKPKFRVRSRPPTDLRLPAKIRSAVASVLELMSALSRAGAGKPGRPGIFWSCGEQPPGPLGGIEDWRETARRAMGASVSRVC